MRSDHHAPSALAPPTAPCADPLPAFAPATQRPLEPTFRRPRSPAGFDVSRCGRYLALCELDPAVGYHLRIFSLQRPTLGSALQTVTLPNCPFVTSVQFCPLTLAVLIGYGRCQVRAKARARARADP